MFAGASSPSILNEVLSLNAQECMVKPCVSTRRTVLNEVLSLNAQELTLSTLPVRHF